MAKILIGGKSIEISDDVLKDAVENKKDISISDKLIVRTEDEDNAFQNNIKSTERTAALEIAVKKTREKLGLNFEGKTIESLVDAVKTKAVEDAKIEPNEQLKALQSDISTLKGTIQSLSSEKESALNQLKQFKVETTVNNTLMSIIPDAVKLPKGDMAILLKNKFQFDQDETGRVIVKQNGEVLKNSTTLDPLQPKEVVEKFFAENPTYLGTGGGGAGAGDSGAGGGKVSIDDYIAKAEKEGRNVTSQEFIKELEQKIKDGLVS